MGKSEGQPLKRPTCGTVPGPFPLLTLPRPSDRLKPRELAAGSPVSGWTLRVWLPPHSDWLSDEDTGSRGCTRGKCADDILSIGEVSTKRAGQRAHLQSDNAAISPASRWFCAGVRLTGLTLGLGLDQTIV